MSRLLNVVSEGGAARYILPLWQRWLREPPGFEWRIVLGDGAASLLAAEQWLDRLPVMAAVDRHSGDVPSVLKGWQPDALLASAGDGYPLETGAVRHVRMLGGNTAQFVDTWYNYARRFRNAGEAGMPEQILVIDDNARREAAEEGIPASKLHIVGQPWWETAPRWRPGPTADVLFLGAPAQRDYGQSLGYDEWDAWDLVCGAAKSAPSMFANLWYGKHPEQKDDRLQKLCVGELVTDSMHFLPKAGTVIGMFSSPMVDAYLSGATVISVQPGAIGPDRCPLSRYGYIARAATAEALLSAMRKPVTSRQRPLVEALQGSTDRLDSFVRDFLLP